MGKSAGVVAVTAPRNFGPLPRAGSVARETLEVRVGPGHKGPHVTEVLSVDSSTSGPVPRRREFRAATSSSPPSEPAGARQRSPFRGMLTITY